MTVPARRLFFGLETLSLDQGGIGRVAHLMVRVAADLAAAGELTIDGMVLRDCNPSSSYPGRFRSAGGSKLRFLAAVNGAAVGHTHFVYDFLGMARAHGWLPFPRRPYLSYIHGIEVWPSSGTHASRLAAARRAAVLVSNSYHTRQRASDLDPTFARAKVCWLATEEDDPPPIGQGTNGPPRALILGRMDEGYKGHRELIACWPQVTAVVPDAVLTIVGRGPRAEEYQKLVAASAVANRIELKGFVPEADMTTLWNQTSVFTMPSRGEGFGLVYVEAMRHGIPVIASVHDAGQEVNLDQQTGYNVNLDRPQELPDRLIHLLRNPDHAASLGANGQKRWADHFRYSAFRDRFRPLLGEFLEL